MGNVEMNLSSSTIAIQNRKEKPYQTQNQTQIDPFQQKYIQLSLQEKHTRVVDAVTRLLTLSLIDHSRQTLHKWTRDLMQKSLLDLQASVTSNHSIAHSRPISNTKSEEIRTEYYFDCQNESAYLSVDNSSPTIKTIEAVYPPECILSRKSCIRVLGVLLGDIQRKAKQKSIKLSMKLPIQLNLLLACAALGLYLKPLPPQQIESLESHESKKGPEDIVEFWLKEDWPIPIQNEDSADLFRSPDALQFRCIYSDSKGSFYRSEYCTESRTFKFREKTSYRYKQYSYFKKHNMLNLRQVTPELIKRLEKLPYPEQQQTLYVEYKHLGYIDVVFLGTVQDFLKKYNLLPAGSKGRKLLLEARVHTFVLVKDKLVQDVYRQLESTLEYSNSNLNILKSDLLLLTENGLRSILSILSSRLSSATLHSTDKRFSSPTSPDSPDSLTNPENPVFDQHNILTGRLSELDAYDDELDDDLNRTTHTGTEKSRKPPQLSLRSQRARQFLLKIQSIADSKL